MNLVGKGFRLSAEEVAELGYDVTALPDVIKPHFNARDLMQRGEPCWAIDLFGLSDKEALDQYPELYNRLLVRVKPERDQNKDPARKRDWWLFGRSNRDLRKALSGLSRMILTPETAKHRVFVFQSMPFCPDHKLYAVATDDALLLGLLSSRLSSLWALRAGGRMGVGNDPVFNNTRCFSTFPFPAFVANGDQEDELKIKIREISEKLDAHRKRQQAQHSGLSLTGMYNVLEKLRSGEQLTAKEKIIHEQGLVSVLRELHDELDRAVFAAYGWEDLAEKLVGRPGATTPLPDKDESQAEAEEELLFRLVALNSERAAEEGRGLIHWLRPDYQNPDNAATKPEQTEADLDEESEAISVTRAPVGKQNWPKEMREQVAAVRSALARHPLTLEDLANQFKRSPKVAALSVLEALKELGMVAQQDDQYSLRA